jgi:predicted dehydrogenase
LRLGLLGAARIAPQALVEPARGLAQVVAVAARDRARAEEFSRRHGIPRVYDSYAALVESPEVDAIYVGLPCSLHHEWTLRALAAGKDVLCEKPLTCNEAQTRELVERAERLGRVLMEAHHWRYHPLAERVRSIVASGVLGPLRRLHAVFDAPIHDPSDIRWSFELGGGSLMDLGCYPVQWLRFVAGSQGKVRSARADEFPRAVDRAMHAELEFPGGIEATLSCSMHPQGSFRATLRVEGLEGTLDVDNPLAPHKGHELVLRTTAGERRERVPGDSTYRHQLEAFLEAAARRTPCLTGGADAIATAALMDSIYTAAGLPLRGTVEEVLA